MVQQNGCIHSLHVSTKLGWVNSVWNYVDDQIHINSMKLFWWMIKKLLHFDKVNLKRYVSKFLGRHNNRELIAINQIKFVVSKLKAGNWNK